MSLNTATQTGPTKRQRGTKCRMGKLIRKLTVDAAKDETASLMLANLYVMLDDDDWEGSTIADELDETATELNDPNYKIPAATINRHRRGDCKCEAL